MEKEWFHRHTRITSWQVHFQWWLLIGRNNWCFKSFQNYDEIFSLNIAPLHLSLLCVRDILHMGRWCFPPWGERNCSRQHHLFEFEGAAALDKIQPLCCESLKENRVFWSFDKGHSKSFFLSLKRLRIIPTFETYNTEINVTNVENKLCKQCKINT